MGHELAGQAFPPEIGVHREIVDVEKRAGRKGGKPFEGDEDAGGKLSLEGEKDMGAGPLAKLGDEALAGRGRKTSGATHDISGVGFKEGKNCFAIGLRFEIGSAGMEFGVQLRHRFHTLQSESTSRLGLLGRRIVIDVARFAD